MAEKPFGGALHLQAILVLFSLLSIQVRVAKYCSGGHKFETPVIEQAYSLTPRFP